MSRFAHWAVSIKVALEAVSRVSTEKWTLDWRNIWGSLSILLGTLNNRRNLEVSLKIKILSSWFTRKDNIQLPRE